MKAIDLDQVEEVRKALSIYPTSTILLALIADYTNDSLIDPTDNPFSAKAVEVLAEALAAFRVLMHQNNG